MKKTSSIGIGCLLPLTALIYACGVDARNESPVAATTVEVHPEQARAIATLESSTQTKWSFAQSKERGSLTHVAGRAAGVLTDRTKSFDATVGFLTQNAGLFRMKSPSTELRESRSRTDALGMHHVRMQQMLRGLPVWAREMTAHYDSAGALVEVDATYTPDLHELDVNPKLTLEEAVAVAKNDMFVTRVIAAATEVKIENPELTVYAPEGAEAALGYHMRLRVAYSPDTGVAVWDDYMIDAHTGAVLNKYDNIKHVEGTGTGALGTSRKFQITQGGAGFQLKDMTRTPAGIHTFDSGNTQQFPQTYVSASTATGFTGPGVDAHAFAGVVYDFYKTKLNRLGIDGKDSAMLSFVHYSNALDNAFWDGQEMAYGDGGQIFRPLAGSLDVVAHEFTHGVTENESNLTYQGQSGAMNESMSDIFGAIIENFSAPDPTKNLLLGEAIGKTGPIRDMVNPANGQQPSNMSELVRTQQDNGGVHINSGIPNNAFALMTVGGTNPKSGTKVAYGIGWDKSAKLWFRVNSELLQASSNFASAAQATARAATDLGFTQNEQNIISCAWIATGVTTGNCETLTPTTTDSPRTPGSGTDGGTSANTLPGSSGTGSTDNSDSTDDSDDSDGTSTKKKKKVYDTQATVGCQAAGSEMPPILGLGVTAAALMLSGLRRRRGTKK